MSERGFVLVCILYLLMFIGTGLYLVYINGESCHAAGGVYTRSGCLKPECVVDHK
jgi:hypothetical protein